MKNLFVSYAIAEKLKEKGFSERPLAVYRMGGELKFIKDDDTIIDSAVGYTLAPLYQQAVDWFREKHNLNVWLIENPYTQGNGSGMYEWNIKPRMAKNQPLPQPRGLGSGCGTEYYEALDNAISQALKLI